MPAAPFSTALARLWRSRGRLIAAVVALVTAVSYWPGWLGWAVGLFAAAGLMFFELRRWWDYLTRGEQATRPSTLSGPARYREPGTTSVRLLDVGDQPNLVAMRLRHITGLDDADASRLMSGVPTTVTHNVSLRSADHVVGALRAAGAHAELRVRGGSVGESSP